jgi:sarcosine oxidase
VKAVSDVAVVGLGAMGSAALLDLARRGVRVTGLDQFHPPHAFGSTHGQSRIIREAYYEDPRYVPLVRRAYQRWALLERETGVEVFRRTGGLMLGPREGALVGGARRSAETHDLPFEELDGEAIGRRFPMFRPGRDTSAILEPRAGVLDPELCLATMLTRAQKLGALVSTGTTVLRWVSGPSAVRLETDHGSLEFGKVVLAAGPWMNGLLGGLLPLEIERQVMFWFRPAAGAALGPERMPVFIWEWEPDRFFYGLPDLGRGVKIAGHHEGQRTTPEQADREVSPEEVAWAKAMVHRFVPGADGDFVGGQTCLYTNTPDQHFVVGLHPADPRIILLSPCSGHGFKFASVIGEIAATLATGGEPALDLSLFSPTRFTKV